jgi:predicted enzyme related to lactoylglutathione lyase
MSKSIENHKIVHIEIPVDDNSKAKEFYETVFEFEVCVNTGYKDYASFNDTFSNNLGLWLGIRYFR